MPAWELAPLSWEAIATFTTGGLAVWAAYKVGCHQIKISKKQTEIANEMRNLEALKIKSDLFDRRLVIFVTARDWLGAFLQTGERPKDEIARRYMMAMEEAQFLYGEETFDLMYGWQDLADEHHLLMALAASDRNDEVNQHAERSIEILREIFTAAKGLRGTFKEALDLSQIG